jgi:translocation and assembly module TamB
VRRVITTALATAAVLLLLLLAGVAALVTTETGLQLVWPRLLALAGPTLSVESVSGRLAGPLRLHGVRYQTDSDTLSADELLLEWQPLALPGGTLQLRQLAGRGVHYRHAGAAPAGDEKPLALPEQIRLPLAIVLQDLRVEEASVALGAGAQAIPIEVLRLAARVEGSRLSVERLELVAPDLQLQGGVTLEAAGAYPVRGEITASAVVPDYAPVEAALHIDGSLAQLGLRLELQPPYAARAELQLERLFDVPQIRATLQLQGTELAAPPCNFRAPSLPPSTPPGRRCGSMRTCVPTGRPIGCSLQRTPVVTASRPARCRPGWPGLCNPMSWCWSR